MSAHSGWGPKWRKEQFLWTPGMKHDLSGQTSERFGNSSFMIIVLKASSIMTGRSSIQRALKSGNHLDFGKSIIHHPSHHFLIGQMGVFELHKLRLQFQCPLVDSTHVILHVNADERLWGHRRYVRHAWNKEMICLSSSDPYLPTSQYYYPLIMRKIPMHEYVSMK